MNPDSARMQHFHALDRQAQADAIRRLAALGWTDHGISDATHLSVEHVRRLLVAYPTERATARRCAGERWNLK